MFPQEAVQRALKLDPCPDRLTTLAALAKEMESGCIGHKKNLPAMLSSPPTPIRFLQKEEIILGQGADFLDQASSNEKHSPPQSIHSQRLGPILFSARAFAPGMASIANKSRQEFIPHARKSMHGALNPSIGMQKSWSHDPHRIIGAQSVHTGFDCSRADERITIE
jgi:hypothetical protein